MMEVKALSKSNSAKIFNKSGFWSSSTKSSPGISSMSSRLTLRWESRKRLRVGPKFAMTSSQRHGCWCEKCKARSWRTLKACLNFCRCISLTTSSSGTLKQFSALWDASRMSVTQASTCSAYRWSNHRWCRSLVRKTAYQLARKKNPCARSDHLLASPDSMSSPLEFWELEWSNNCSRFASNLRTTNHLVTSSKHLWSKWSKTCPLKVDACTLSCKLCLT